MRAFMWCRRSGCVLLAVAGLQMLRHAAAKLGMPNVAEELCDKLDKNNDGEIDFDEFVDGYGLFKKMLNRQWEEYEATSPDPSGRSSPVSLATDKQEEGSKPDGALESHAEPESEPEPVAEPASA